MLRHPHPKVLHTRLSPKKTAGLLMLLAIIGINALQAQTPLHMRGDYGGSAYEIPDYGHYQFTPGSIDSACRTHPGGLVLKLPPHSMAHFYTNKIILNDPAEVYVRFFDHPIRDASYATPMYYKTLHVYTSDAPDTLDFWCSGRETVMILLECDGPDTSDWLHLYVDVCDMDGTHAIPDAEIEYQGTQISVNWNDPFGSDRWVVEWGDREVFDIWQTNTVSEPSLVIPIDSIPYHSGFDTLLPLLVKIQGNAPDMPRGGCLVRPREYRMPTFSDDDLMTDFSELSSSNTQAYLADTIYADGTVRWRPINDLFINEEDLEYKESAHHVIYTDPERTDRFTGNQLKVIPPGETRSVRLGTNKPHGYGSKVLYRYHVDTSLADLLTLQYAGVMEYPFHHGWENPYIQLAIYDEDMRPVDTNCYHFTFQANGNPDWEQIRDTVWRYWKNNLGEMDSTIESIKRYMWKDWSGIGLDLRQFHTRTIYVEVSTRECIYTHHFAYTYYTLHSSKMHLSSNACGEDMPDTLYAPEGFSYDWYDQENPYQTLGTERAFPVPHPGTYVCELYYAGNQNTTCTSKLKTKVGPRFPKAGFTIQDTKAQGCGQLVDFKNQSWIFSDRECTQNTHAHCDRYYWDFGDSTTSTETNPSHYFPTDTYNMSLIAEIDGGCRDTFYYTLEVPDQSTYCDTLQWISPYDLPWTFNQTTFSHPVEDTLMLLTNSIGCDSFLTYTLRIIDEPVIDSRQACLNELPIEFHGFTFTGYGILDTLILDSATNIYTRYLLTVNPYEGTDTTIHIFICLGETVEFDGHTYEEEGEYRLHYFTAEGCDSIVVLNIWFNRECTDVWFPNTITPNQPTNQCFSGISSDLLELETWIYDRNGRLTAHLPDMGQQWCPQASSTPQATYTYTALYRLGAHPGRLLRRTGTVTVVY